MTDDERHCCTDTPEPDRDNPPGLRTLRYRIGTYNEFFDRMTARLSRQIIPPDGNPATSSRPLRALTTRAKDDGTIAIIDAFACVCDVLTFYTQVGFNEGFLPTATERRSVFEVARSIGYRPAPGVAASTRLAFTLEDATGAAETTTIPVGTQVMSVPGADEKPQMFETTEEVLGRPEWNAMRPAQDREQIIDYTTDVLYLEGISTRLSVGDALVVVGRLRSEDTGSELDEHWDLRFVTEVTVDSDRLHTKVRLDRPLGDHEGMPDPPGLPRTHPAQFEQRVFTFRQRGSLFGHVAPDFRVMNDDIKAAFGGSDRTTWPNFKLAEDSTTGSYLARVPSQGVIDLDREYPQVVQDSWVCLHDRTEVELFRVTKASPTSRTDFSITAKCTRVFLDGTEHLDRFNRRSTVVHLGSEELGIAKTPWVDPIGGQSIELDRLVAPMAPHRQVLVQGVDAGSGEAAVEVAWIKDWQTSADGQRSVVVFTEALAHTYQRESLQVLGNIAQSTHGETIAAEHLGSGDAAVPHQAFALRHAPLTFVPASTPSGGASTLDLRIDGVSWRQIDALYDAGPNDRVYELRVAYDGTAVAQLGDGKHGARATTGMENVVATYRKGIGLSGEVGPGTLTLLRSRPLGVREVTNPRGATGAADAEGVEDIRSSAPLTVLTLDRLVSLQDYEDFARAFAGIGKARAVRLWDGKRGFVHVTVASASGQELPADHDTLLALEEAFARYQDPTHVVVVGPHVERRFACSMRVLPEPDRLREDIEQAIRDYIEAAFSFEARTFGQPTATSEIITVAHRAAGVRAVYIDQLHRVDGSVGLSSILTAALPAWDGGVVTPAELLIVDPDLMEVSWMS